MRIIGPNPTLVSWRLEKDPTKGFSSIYTWEGSRAAVFGLATMVTSDQKYSIDDSDKPLYRIVISSPDSGASDVSTDYILEWELLGNDVEKSVYEHPNALALGDKMLTAIKIAIKEIEDASVLDSSTVYATNETNLTAIATLIGVSSANALSLFRLIVKGTTAFVLSQYVLRRTQTVSSRAQLQYSYANVEKIHTAAQVWADSTMPEPVRFVISTMTAPTAQAGYTWGWLKKTPTLTQAAANKFQSTQEWWLDQWSDFLYLPV